MLINKNRIPVKDILIYGLLPSFLKIIFYRLKGYKIGKRVSIGFGSVIIGKNVTIGDYTSIGFLTIIRGQKIKIGAYVSIGSITFIDTPIMEIGDGSKINEQVFIGGLQFPDSRFIMGSNCQIMQMSFINPAKSIVIGNDTGIGGDCLLFGHTSWLSAFEGYEVNFDDIQIGNSVSLAWRVFVLPGTTIGDGSVIGANSLVNRKIPPKCLAVGFPAKIVKKFPDFPREVTNEEKVNLLKNIIDEMMSYFNAYGIQCDKREDHLYEIKWKKKLFLRIRPNSWKMKILFSAFANDFNILKGNNCNLVVSLYEIPVSVRLSLNQQKISWIDIQKKEQPFIINELGAEVASFLKRYGVRLDRVR